MNYFEGLEFFLFLLIVLCGGFVLNFFGKKKEVYILAISLIFAGTIYGQSKKMVVYLVAFIIYQYLLVMLSNRLEKKWLKTLSLLSVVPLVINKIFAITSLHLMAFIGISYMSFKTIQIMIEISDGIIKEKYSFLDYLQFLLFFPTVSSGPIDRSRRFFDDIKTIMPREAYLELAGTGVYRVVLGLLYKIMFSTYVYQMLSALKNTGTLTYSVKYMYLYKPFLSIDIKDFWTRWHITLSTWLRDFVFSRVLMNAMKKKLFKSRLQNASFAYMVNMCVMGFWHGLSISYVIYGVYHGFLMAGFEWYQKKSKFYKKNKNKTWYKLTSWFVTMHLVFIGFFIFSGEPLKLIMSILER